MMVVLNASVRKIKFGLHKDINTTVVKLLVSYTGACVVFIFFYKNTEIKRNFFGNFLHCFTSRQLIMMTFAFLKKI